MPEQYHTTDKRTGLEVALTGTFPDHQDDRIRIARTTNLFTRLMSTILMTENESDRRERFSAIEMQLEVADALIQQDFEEVSRLLRATMAKMGVSQDDLDELARRVIEELGHLQEHGGPEGQGAGEGPVNLDWHTGEDGGDAPGADDPQDGDDGPEGDDGDPEGDDGEPAR